MQHGVMPLDAGADNLLKAFGQPGVKDHAPPGRRIKMGIMQEDRLGGLTFPLYQITVTPRPNPPDGFLAPLSDYLDHFSTKFIDLLR